MPVFGITFDVIDEAIRSFDSCGLNARGDFEEILIDVTLVYCLRKVYC